MNGILNRPTTKSGTDKISDVGRIFIAGDRSLPGEQAKTGQRDMFRLDGRVKERK
jgi:hypothetical protein